MVTNGEDAPETPAAAASPASQWAPFHGAHDFGVNMVITLAALFCALGFAFAASVIVRRLLRRQRRVAQRTDSHASADPEKPAVDNGAGQPSKALPVLVFSTGTGVPGGRAECAICLLEFADGESVRVLPSCGHGFHVGCVDPWIVSHGSCPTCRKSCGSGGG